MGLWSSGNAVFRRPAPNDWVESGQDDARPSSLGLQRIGDNTLMLIAGIILILVGLGYGLWCLVRHWRTRWVAKVDAEALTVTNGSRRRRLVWSEIGAVEVEKNQVRIFDRHRMKQLTLGVDRTPRAHQSLQSMLDAIAVHRARHDS
jgi:hypothetical protein